MAFQAFNLLTRENKTGQDMILNAFLSVVIGTSLYTVFWLWTFYINASFKYEVFIINLIIITLWAIIGLLIAWLSTVPVRRGIKLWKGILASLFFTGVISVTGFIGFFIALVVLLLLGVPPETFTPK